MFEAFMMQKTPLRLCVGCRALIPAEQAARFVRTAEGVLLERPFVKHRPGRGAYVCFRQTCLRAALAKRGKRPPLAFALKISLPQDLIQRIEEVFESAP